MNKVIETIEQGRTIYVALAIVVSVSVWAADQRYVTDASMNSYVIQQRLQVINDDLDDLESVPIVKLTDRERGKLKRRLREREELLKKIGEK